jgi:serine/threonine protein kinase
MIGQTVSHYRIIEKLGGGGMGVVYKAEDTKLKRAVALKFLPEELSRDRHALERFEREAQAASALNHPNVCTIYDIDEHQGQHFIAMEYLEGQTLSHRIRGRPLGTDEILELAIQIAGGLDAAHSKGITHRDIKPANLFVTTSGHAKILDFGLAKLTPAELQGGDAVTATATTETAEPMLTSPGTAVGTVAYMSPEQALCKELDARTDLFSLGAVLYEMATGMLPFRGTSSAATFNAILNSVPTAPVRINPDLSAELERIINKALEKDRDIRYQHASDLRADLRRLKRDTESGRAAVAPARTRWRQYTKPAAILATAAALAALGWFWFGRSRLPTPEAPLTIVPLTSYSGEESSPSFSPDGNQVAFSWSGERQDNQDIYVKQIPVEPPSRLTSDPAWDYSPAWSPDGQNIAFRRALSRGKDAIMLIPQRGGQEMVLAEINLPDNALPLTRRSLAWTPDSKWLACPVPEAGQQYWALHLFSVETGERRRLTNPPSGIVGDTAPAFSPDGSYLVLAREINTWNFSDLYLLHLGEGYSPLGDPERIVLDKPFNTDAVWMPNGREIVFVSGTYTESGLWHMIASNPATRKRLAFAPSGVSAPAVSQQGHRLAYALWKADQNIWRIDFHEPGRKPSAAVPFISSTKLEYMPAYSPDGKRIAFASDRAGTFEIWVCDGNGSKAVQLTSFEGADVFGPRWSWDNQNIAFTVGQKETKEDVYVVGATGGVSRRLTTHPAEDQWPYWSRDGKWIYFTSGRAGQAEIWKMPASGGEAIQVTRNGGGTPEESPDGRFLYYERGWPGLLSVWRIPLEGGEETKVLDSVHPLGGWEIANDGIWFFRGPDAKGHSDVCLYDFATGKSRRVLTVEREVAFRIAVSPDGNTILYTQLDEAGSDLMLVENFR